MSFSTRENTVDYLEIPSLNLAQTKTFFSELFGWKFEDYGQDYSCFNDGRIAGGFFTSKQVWTTDMGAPLIVFYHEELEKIRDRAVQLGAKIRRDIFPFPGGHRFHFEAPGTGEFAIWSEK
jgi:predicted enzyme related to lactoylglutathione lyase